ncbi:MAG: hypothetical protein HAW63_05750 [Bdellovibrionaceae bacterium]|nr:hypothetical protein [Pseudobdellovibrionaceae bacterium]
MRSFFHRPKFSSKKTYRRPLFILTFLLLAIIFLQHELTQPKFKKGINSLLNVSQSAVRLSKTEPLTAKLVKQTLFWCSTRVIELNVGQKVIKNKNFKWYLNNTAIDSLFMERWLAKYCRLNIFNIAKVAEAKKEQGKKLLFCVTFINKGKQCFYKTATLAFTWKNKMFLSPQLKEGFNKILFLTNKR